MCHPGHDTMKKPATHKLNMLVRESWSTMSSELRGTARNLIPKVKPRKEVRAASGTGLASSEAEKVS